MIEKAEAAETPSGLPDLKSGPWLVFRHAHNKSQSLYSFSEQRIYIRSIHELSNMMVWRATVTPEGWLVLFAAPSRSGSGQCLLLNPSTKEKVKLPPMSWKGRKKQSNDNNICYKCFLSTSLPTDPDCIVMVINFSDCYFALCRPHRDRKWTVHGCDLQDEFGCKLVDATAMGGKFYGLTSDFRVAILFDAAAATCISVHNKQHRITVQDVAWSAMIFGEYCIRYRPNLLSSRGDLFLVIHCYTGQAKGQVGVNVFKLVDDEVEQKKKKKRWRRVFDIGDQVFFLSRSYCSASWPASSEHDGGGQKRGCIYFTEEDDKKSLYVFDLEEGTISAKLPCPNLDTRCSHPLLLLPAPAPAGPIMHA